MALVRRSSATTADAQEPEDPRAACEKHRQPCYPQDWLAEGGFDAEIFTQGGVVDRFVERSEEDGRDGGCDDGREAGEGGDGSREERTPFAEERGDAEEEYEGCA